MLEIGYGVGANWPLLPASIEYTGIEPDPHMRERAERYLPAGAAFNLLDADAHALPFEDEVFDTVLVTQVLCTVDHPDRALAEAFRVVKPGGQLRFLEHVRPRNVAGRAVLGAVTPIYAKFAGGCHLNRDTEAAIRRAGFVIEDLRHVKLSALPAIVGRATRPPANT